MTTKDYTGPFTIKLRSVGNPDFSQYAPLSPAQTVKVETLEHAVSAFHSYSSEWNLGGGNVPETFIMQGKTKIARISANGRLWAMDGTEIEQEGVKTVAQCESEGWR